MTKVSYVLKNGLEVKTLMEAVNSGMSYKVRYSPVVEKGNKKVSLKRRAMFGLK